MAHPLAGEYKVVRAHCLGGARGDVAIGATLRVPEDVGPDAIAHKLMLGYVVPVTETGASADDPRAPEEEPEEETIEHGDPEPVDRDPKPARKRKSRKTRPR